MSIDPPKIGFLIGHNEKPPRDAIHIAIAPVTAHEQLKPGQFINFLVDDWNKHHDQLVVASSTPIGIVDPFLLNAVPVGARFYMFLFPYTITSLNHNWTHPAFPTVDNNAVSAAKKQAAMKWVANFASGINQTYEDLMVAADSYQKSGWCTPDNTESYNYTTYGSWIKFWTKYEIIREVQITDKETTPFTCSC